MLHGGESHRSSDGAVSQLTNITTTLPATAIVEPWLAQLRNEGWSQLGYAGDADAAIATVTRGDISGRKTLVVGVSRLAAGEYAAQLSLSRRVQQTAAER